MDKIVQNHTSDAMVKNNGNPCSSPVEVNPYFVSNRDVGVTVMESNGSSVVLLKQINNCVSENGINTSSTMVNAKDIINTGTVLGAQKSLQQSSLVTSDIEFTSLLSKHLYSTTMTGSGPQISEQVASEVKVTAIAETLKESPVVVLPAQNQISVHPDLLRIGSLINNQNLLIGNGQGMPQIIYVPIIAAAPPQQSAGEAVVAAAAPTGTPILANAISPVNYGMIGALPLTSPPNNINNLVYVPQAPTLFNPLAAHQQTPLSLLNPLAAQQQTPLTLLNPLAAQQQTPLSLLNPLAAQQQTPLTLLNPLAAQQQTPLVSTPLSPTPLVTLIQPPTSTLFNIVGAQSPTSVINLNQPLVSMLNLAVKPASSVLNSEDRIVNQLGMVSPVQSIMNQLGMVSPVQSISSESNGHNITGISPRETKGRVQKRKLSRNKSCSSDASSVDSSMTDGQCVSSASYKFNNNGSSPCTKKIERVRKTVNTEEELNNKVSGLVSKILSQFPKGESNSKSRTCQKSPKRTKIDNISSQSKCNILDNEFIPNTVIPSSVILAGEENAVENVSYNNTYINNTPQLLEATSSQQVVENNSYNQTIQLVPHRASLNDSVLNSPVEASKFVTSTLLAPTKYVQISTPTYNAQMVSQRSSDEITNKPLVSSIQLSTIISNPAVIVDSRETQIPLEYVQIVQGNPATDDEGNIDGSVDHSFSVQEVSVRTEDTISNQDVE